MNATQAFNNHLQQLCLDNFPSGKGPWRQDYQLSKSRSKLQELQNGKVNVNHHSIVTLKDYDANYERTEALSEYVSAKKSPWLMDYSWSREAKSLRELAVKSPWMVDRIFTLNHFKTLRILDKNIQEIDRDLRLLVNLEELTLSANYIKSVNSENLPPNLKVLELCANCIDNLDGLTNSIRPLEHLGLGRNRLTSIGTHISGDFWPNLLSLDLSNNDLCDLVDIVGSLSSLPRLRCLVLNGNPLALIPGYRGFVIDSMRKLLILDDARITSDEKHYFRGLARRKEFIVEENVVILTADNIKYLPVPDEVKSPADFPEYPVIVRKYLVQFWYPEATVVEPTPRESQLGEEIVEEDKTNTKPKREPTPDKEFVTKVKELEVLSKEEHGISLIPIRSESVEYSPEGVELLWTRRVVCDRLVELRDFFSSVGLHFDIVEEKSLLYPPDELPQESPSKTHSAHKKGKKEEKGKAADAPKKDDKGKKKKAVDRSAMVAYSVEYSLLASFWTNSSAFIEGENLVKMTMSTEGRVPTPPPSPEPDEDPKGKKKDDKKGGKDKPAPKSGKSGKSGKKEEGVEEDVPPPPLQVKVAFEMECWKSAKDCPMKSDGV